MAVAPAEGPGEAPPIAPQGAAFAALQQRFRAGLAERARQIRQAPDRSTQAALLHRLAGAAGGFGFAALGEAARSAMEQCEHCDASGATAAPAADIDAGIEAVLTLLEQAAQG